MFCLYYPVSDTILHVRFLKFSYIFVKVFVIIFVITFVNTFCYIMQMEPISNSIYVITYIIVFGPWNLNTRSARHWRFENGEINPIYGEEEIILLKDPFFKILSWRPIGSFNLRVENKSLEVLPDQNALTTELRQDTLTPETQ